MVGPEAFGEVFFSELTATPVILVLDDFHNLQTNSLVHRAICAGMEQSTKLRWLIASRDPPPAPMARLVANDWIVLFSSDELKFNLEETEQLMRRHNPALAAQENIISLFNLSEGWAAGLMLLIKQQNISDLPSPSKGLVFAYFRHEVLAQFDQEVQAFFLPGVISLRPISLNAMKFTLWMTV